MKYLANVLKRVHHFLKRFALWQEFVFFVKKIYGFCSGKYCFYRSPDWVNLKHKGNISDLKFAVICDEMTWENMSSEFNVVYLTPKNWCRVLEIEKPDILFCEATWEGLSGNWQNQIFHNQNLRQDNRFVLKDILRYCHNAQISTIFWNKEDRPAFQDAPFSFVDTALLFDHIFTTCLECIAKYQKLGHKSVHLMKFGFSPKLFSPLPMPVKTGIAMFFGSWYKNNPERCQAMQEIFDMVLNKGLHLVIYDRVSDRQNEDRRFPEKYRSYIRDKVPYRQIRKELKEAEYVININSVTDSDTMFARRVFETMACGRILISNDSLGLRRRFPSHIWFMNEDFAWENAQQIIQDNIKVVYEKYTFYKQMEEALIEAKII